MASDAEQRYLAAMADVGDGPVRSAEVAARAGYKDSGSASVVRDSLLRRISCIAPGEASSTSRFRCLAVSWDEHPLAGLDGD
jgi:hypothetical protein